MFDIIVKFDFTHVLIFSTFFLFPSQGKYEGEWKDDRRHGYGVFTDPKSGYRYEGQWHNSRRHGQGTMLMPNGDSFAGTWTAGKCSVVEFSFAANSPWADPEF